MKKIGVVASFLLTLALILPVSAADLFQKDLKYGMVRNKDVKQLQQYLKDEKLYTGPISGNYYNLTKSAVIKLQKKLAVKTDGNFSKTTREKLNPLLAKQEQVPTLQSEAQQLAESIEALRMYDSQKLKSQQEVQSGVISSEEFALKYPDYSSYLPNSSTNQTRPTTQQENLPTQNSNQPTKSAPISETTPPIIPTLPTPPASSPATTTPVELNSIVADCYSTSTNPYQRIKYFAVNDSVVSSTAPIPLTSWDAYLARKLPELSSITIRNNGNADLKKLNLLAESQGISLISPNSGSRPYTITTSTAYFPIGTQLINGNYNGVPSIFKTNFALYFRIDTSKLDPSDTLDLEVTDVQVTSTVRGVAGFEADLTKSYTVKLPPDAGMGMYCGS